MQVTHLHFPVIHSTNTWAKEHVESLEPDSLTVISAAQQTAGRGRFKRPWLSPPDVNIYATFCFFVEENLSDLRQVPQFFAALLCELLAEMGFCPSIKWPNDILLANQKVAGILCETVEIHPNRAVLCGLGINVNMPQEEIKKIDQLATSLAQEGGKQFDVQQTLHQLILRVQKNLPLFLQEGFSPFFSRFLHYFSLKPGDFLSFHRSQEVIKGFFYRLNEDGSLMIQRPSGEVETYYSGELL
jgi:BirA family transcriptional regulator, biotin operon repressor / biotin---[acetyl-CoA-carboxylase] ligase